MQSSRSRRRILALLQCGAGDPAAGRSGPLYPTVRVACLKKLGRIGHLYSITCCRLLASEALLMIAFFLGHTLVYFTAPPCLSRRLPLRGHSYPHLLQSCKNPRTLFGRKPRLTSYSSAWASDFMQSNEFVE